MELLYPYKKASLTQIPIEKPVRESSFGQELIALLFGINDWLEKPGNAPCIYNSR